jgi:hypothetical protein
LRLKPGVGSVAVEIDRLIELEDIRSTVLYGRIPGAIRANDDVLRHTPEYLAKSSYIQWGWVYDLRARGSTVSRKSSTIMKWVGYATAILAYDRYVIEPIGIGERSLGA